MMRLKFVGNIKDTSLLKLVQIFAMGFICTLTLNLVKELFVC